MKTEELWDENKHDSWVMYKKDFMFCLGEKDAEIVKIIDGDIKFAKSKLENKDLSAAMQNYYKGQVNVLAYLKEKINFDIVK